MFCDRPVFKATTAACWRRLFRVLPHVQGRIPDQKGALSDIRPSERLQDIRKYGVLAFCGGGEILLELWITQRALALAILVCHRIDTVFPHRFGVPPIK